MNWNDLTVYAGPSNLSTSDITTNDYKCGRPAANKKYSVNAASSDMNETKINKLLRNGGKIGGCNYSGKLDKIVIHFDA